MRDSRPCASTDVPGTDAYGRRPSSDAVSRACSSVVSRSLAWYRRATVDSGPESATRRFPLPWCLGRVFSRLWFCSSGTGPLRSILCTRDVVKPQKHGVSRVRNKCVGRREFVERRQSPLERRSQLPGRVACRQPMHATRRAIVCKALSISRGGRSSTGSFSAFLVKRNVYRFAGLAPGRQTQIGFMIAPSAPLWNLLSDLRFPPPRFFSNAD